MTKLHSQHERGVSLVITFVVVTIMLAIILSVSVLILSEIKVLGNIGNSVSAFYAAHSGIEKTLYYDRKQIIGGAQRGLCTLCSACGNEQCPGCDKDGPGPGCNPTKCDNCEVTYDYEFEGREYSVIATISTSGPQGSEVSLFSIESRGLYRDTRRAVELTSD